MKKIITILLLCAFSKISNGQHYFVIPTMNNPEGKAELISKTFYKLSRPLQTDTTKFLFGYIKHPLNDSIAIVIDSAINIPKGSINATIITEWIDETYPGITNPQRNQLTNYINNNQLLRISNLILKRIKLWTHEEMSLREWFNFSF